MNIQINVGSLRTALSRLKPLVTAYDQHVVLDHREGYAWVTASKGTVTASSQVGPAGEFRPVAFNYRRLRGLIGPFKASDSIALDLSRHSIRLRYRNGVRAEAQLRLWDSKAVPIFEPASEASPWTPAGEIADLREVMRCRHAAAPDDSRPVLTGVFLDTTEGCTAVAADGFRLATNPVQLAGFPEIPESKGINVPVSALDILDLTGVYLWKLDLHMGEVLDVEKPLNIRFSSPSFVLVTWLLLGESFPNWRPLMPKNTTQVVLNASYLTTALEFLAPIAENNSGIIRLLARGDAVRLYCYDDHEESDAYVELPVVEHRGPKWHTAFSQRYFREALQHTALLDVEVSGTTTTAPIMLTGGSYREVVMPIFVGYDSEAARLPMAWYDAELEVAVAAAL